MTEAKDLARRSFAPPAANGTMILTDSAAAGGSPQIMRPAANVIAKRRSDKRPTVSLWLPTDIFSDPAPADDVLLHICDAPFGRHSSPREKAASFHAPQ